MSLIKLYSRMETYDSFPQAPSEEVILGTQEGWNLSPVRRFFCLLVTFDLMFTSLLWALCVILVSETKAKGDHNLVVAFEAEILSYSLEISIFDMVMCAGSRFVILILFYAILSCRHWFPVACSTAGSCAFLVAKVLLFEWAEYGQGSPWPVLLVLSSFVIAWVEAWFLDFRVIPIERQAAIYLSRQLARANGGAAVASWVGAQRTRTPGAFRSYPESASQFYSPLESPYHSDSENESDMDGALDRRRKSGHRHVESVESKMWVQQGPIVARELMTKVRSFGWNVEKVMENGDRVYSKKLHRKIFMISGTILAPPKKIIQELFHNLERMTEWNASVSYCEILQILNDSTDVSYQVTKEGAGGIISARDFVTLRHYSVTPDASHVLAWTSVKHPDKTIMANIIRGTHGVGGWLLSPASVNPRHTDFHWLLDVELELSRLIPNRVVDNAFIAASLDTVNCLRLKLAYTTEATEDIIVEYPTISLAFRDQAGGSTPNVPTVVPVDGAA